MPLLAQVKLLRVLQEQLFERVGGNETVRTDVRVIAATNTDLEQRASSGQFRQDLYFRLNVFAVHLPPLRDRGDDIDLLADHYLGRFVREFGRSALVVRPRLGRLRAYRWPGNVRGSRVPSSRPSSRPAGPSSSPNPSPWESRRPPRPFRRQRYHRESRSARPSTGAGIWPTAWNPIPTTCTRSAWPSWNAHF